MSLRDRDVLEALRSVKYPGFTRDIVSFGIVHDLAIDGGRVSLRLEVGGVRPEIAARIRDEVAAAVRALPGVTGVGVALPPPSAAHGPQRSLPQLDSHPAETPLLPGVKHVVAVASGKGGVGKSTVAVNLAVAMARSGATTGLMDADIYGPSIPMMTGVSEQPVVDDARRIVPFERHGVRLMSIGFLVPTDSAVIWRGPLVMKAIKELLRDVAWGSLDVLVVDLPPGTGDVQLSLAQNVPLAGAVIVTTPQDVALADAIKGVAMFRKVEVPVLGIVENMSYFTCPHCGTRTDVFGHGGGRAEAKRLGVPFLGEIPLDPAIRDAGDRGSPIVVADPSSPQAEAFGRLASHLLATLDTSLGNDPGTPA